MPVNTVLFSIAASRIVFSSSSFENVRGNSEGRVGIRCGIFNAQRGERKIFGVRKLEVKTSLLYLEVEVLYFSWRFKRLYSFLRSCGRGGRSPLVVRVKAVVSLMLRYNPRMRGEGVDVRKLQC